MSENQVFGERHFDVGLSVEAVNKAAATAMAEDKLEHTVSAESTAKNAAMAMPAAVQSKLREGKPLAALLRDFPLSFMEIAKVLTYGATKHGAHDWTFLPESAIKEYEHAADRHDLACWSGELVDADSQCLHEAMAITDRLIAFELRLRYVREKMEG